MRKVRLYIGDQLVDLPEGVSLPITYTTEDFKNPTIVKNSFSKTISLPNTDTNNKIFNHFYKLDRYQHNSGFNPSKRVDAKIYCDGELLESGYIQLNSITGIGEDKKYNITMYGGLGDFFYGLKYNEDGTTKTLADLQFFVLDDNNKLRPKDEELTFNINKEFVSECFDKDWVANGDKITDFITFIPANNGLYEDFDSGHCLIVPDGTTFPTSVKDGTGEDAVTYTTKDGYALASLEKDYTEWQMRDLRSYKQRPAIKVSKLIETICREANSGYKVNFDKAFFSNTNPYWSKSFIALPLLGSEAEEGTVRNDSPVTQKISFPDSGYWVGVKGTTSTNEQWARYVPDTYFDVSGDYIDLSGLPELAELDIGIDIQIRLHPENTNFDEWFNTQSYHLYSKRGQLATAGKAYGGSFTAQLLLIDEDSNTVGYSNLYNFTNGVQVHPLSGRSVIVTPNPDNWNDYVPIEPDSSITTINGSYKKVGDQYYWYTNNGGNTIRLSIGNWLKKADKVKVCLVICCESMKSDDGETYPLDSRISVLYNTASVRNNGGTISGNPQSCFAWYEPLYDPSTSRITVKWDNAIISDAPITKEMLLKTEASPADYLLSYAKMFGLYFVKDVDSKTITIYNRNSFFKNEVEDWTDKIDYSKDMTITPLLFDKKWYLMSLETPETYFAKKYNTEYDLTYGQQRLDTGYSFNSETTELYSENIFENVISATDSDKYFRNFYNSKGALVPAFLNDNITYTLYNGDDSFDKDIYGYQTISTSKTQDWSVTPGADLFAKPCFFSLDNDEKSLEEITNALVFYNGHKDLVDYRGSTVPFWITDDLSAMAALNDKTACFLWTNSETYNDKKIAIKKTRLPQYISYVIDKNNNVTESLDFGLPREMYVDKVNYSEDTTIYANFWDSFYRDQFNVNTKKVTCYVKLERAKQDLLRKFYFFDNAIWILNKIDSYDVTSYGTTRCEFIKVQDMQNYLWGVKDYSNRFDVTGELNPAGGTSVLTLDSSYNWSVYSHNFSSLTPTSGTVGTSNITVTYPANNTASEVVYRIMFDVTGFAVKKTASFLLRPNPANYIKVEGFVDNYPSGARLYIESESTTNSVMLSGDSQYYTLYIEKDTPFRLYVQYNDETLYDQSFSGSAVDIVHHIDVNYSYYINWSTSLPVVDGYIEVDWNTLSIPVVINSNVDWIYADGSSTGTMTPGSGLSGITEIQIKPYEENIYNSEITGYVQLQDSENKDVVTIIRWKQKVKSEDVSYYIDYSTTLPIEDDYITVDWDTMSIPVTITSNVPWTYTDGSSTCTMSPTSGEAGTTNIDILPEEENIYDSEMTGYVQLDDAADYNVTKIIRWKQKVNPNITVSGTVYDFPTGSVLYCEENGTTTQSKNLSSDGSYRFTIARNVPYRLYVKYGDETLFDQSYDAASANVMSDIVIDDFIIYTTDLPINGEYIEVDWDTLSIPVTVVSNVDWTYIDGTSTCTMTPTQGLAGITEIEIQPYETNIYDSEITGYVQLEDANDSVSMKIRWRQLPQS